MQMHTLKDTSRTRKNVQRVGRGPGSNRGKTSCRGHKGDGSRSGYKRRYGYEGGAVPLFQKVPTRGFTRGRFLKQVHTLNLGQLNDIFQDGEVVSLETLYAKGKIPGKKKATLRILAKGELKKKVTIEAHHFSKSAVEKLEKASVKHTVLKSISSDKTE